MPPPRVTAIRSRRTAPNSRRRSPSHENPRDPLLLYRALRRAATRRLLLLAARPLAPRHVFEPTYGLGGRAADVPAGQERPAAHGRGVTWLFADPPEDDDSWLDSPTWLGRSANRPPATRHRPPLPYPVCG